MNDPILLRVCQPFSPVLAYLTAAVVALVCWYGWTYEIFFYGGDLAHYGPLARLAGVLTWPITGGKNFLPPSNPISTVLLTWLLWFVSLRVVIAGWNAAVARLVRTTGAEESGR